MLAANPLSKVPCLITDDGMALFDSPVICEYLDSLDGAVPLFPRPGRGRWKALKQQALADGIMDAAVLRRGESTRPPEAAREAVMARQQAAMERGLDELEREPPPKTLDIGSIAVACALGYLDFRFAAEDWRRGGRFWRRGSRRSASEPALARTAPPARLSRAWSISPIRRRRPARWFARSASRRIPRAAIIARPGATARRTAGAAPARQFCSCLPAGRGQPLAPGRCGGTVDLAGRRGRCGWRCPQMGGGRGEACSGPRPGEGHALHGLVPAGVWQSARSLGAWTLVTCTVAPAFRFEGFEMAPAGWKPGA